MYFGLTTNSKSQGSIKPFGSFERLQEAIGGAKAQASSQISPIRCLYWRFCGLSLVFSLPPCRRLGRQSAVASRTTNRLCLQITDYEVVETDGGSVRRRAVGHEMQNNFRVGKMLAWMLGGALYSIGRLIPECFPVSWHKSC